MQRTLIITAIVIASLASIVVLAAAALFHTPPGRNFIITQIESEIAASVGGAAEIGALKGSLPGHIVVEDLVLSDQQGPWATIDRIELRWRPFALIDRAVRIDNVAIEHAALLREPPDRPDDGEDEPLTIKLPEQLPLIAIRDLKIVNFSSNLGGVPARFDGAGSLDMGGEAVSVRLNLASADNSETIRLAADVSPDADRLFIDAEVVASETGLIAAIADLGGPISLRINADGPTDDAEITLRGVVGAYGAVDARLDADLAGAVSVSAKGTYTAGSRLADIAELSEPVAFDVALQDMRRGGQLTINRMTGAPGEVAGNIVWRALRERDNNLSADLSFAFAETYRPEIQAYLGANLKVQTDLRRRPTDYAATLRIGAEGVDIMITDGESDLETIYKGVLSAVIAPRDEILAEETRVDTRFDIDVQDKAAFRNLRVAIGDIAAAEGEADFDFKDASLRLDANVVAEPAFVTWLAPTLSPQGAISANIEAIGAAQDFSLNATAETPIIGIGDGAAPALTARLALAGLPSLPNGEINADAVNGAGSFAATVQSSEDEGIAAPLIAYNGPGFSLNGSAAFHPASQSGEIDLTYEGDGGAEPWPGLNLVGALDATGRFARQNGNTKLAVNADALRANNIVIEGLRLRASGPPEAIATTLNATRITPADDTDITDVAVGAAIDIRSALRIWLTQMRATLLENDLSLLEPGTIVFQDGAQIDNLRLGWGRNGRIAVDGSFNDTRWRGAFDLSGVNIPLTDGRGTMKVDLDTDAPEPAAGSFTLRSLISEEEASISGDVRWDGESLIVSSIPDRDALEMRLSLPAKLIRAPALAVETDGPLDGYIRYDGAIEPFAAFFPSTLQTLEGFLAVNFRVGGTTDNPELIGAAEITDGAYTELRSGLSIAGLRTRADASYSAAGTRIEFSGGARGGGQSGADTITISGDMTLAETSRIDLAVEFANAELSASPINVLRADGAIEIAGPLDAVAAKGDISVKELDAEIVTPESTGLVPIEVVNIEDMADDSRAPPAATTTRLELNVNVVADDRIFIRGRGLDSEWAANVRAVTQRTQPVIIGDVALRRGALDFSGRRFTLTRGEIAFDDLSPNNPLLDIRAEHETGDGVTAAIVISGRSKEPVIELVSTPTQPQEDVMALVLFGKPASELTAFESLQAAQALASLGGIGPFGGGGITGSIRQATGLDMLNFDIDPENGGGSLTVGKYVADGLFVSATQDAQGKGGSVIVEYEITDNISVETEVRQDGDQTVSANWKRDF